MQDKHLHIGATVKFWQEYEVVPIIHWAGKICNWWNLVEKYQESPFKLAVGSSNNWLQ